MLRGARSGSFPYAAVVFLVMVVGSASCGPSNSHAHSGESLPIQPIATTATPTPLSVQTARAVLTKFAAQAFATLDLAQVSAGFHLVRPSPNYAPSPGAIVLRRQSGAPHPLSVTQYSYPSIAPDSIEVDIGIQSYWAPGALTTGTQESIGGRSGYEIAGGPDAYVFAFQMGVLDSEQLWCKVTAPGTIGQPGFAAFVASLH